MLALLATAPAASAADPIMPLAEVRPGMHCTGLSVVRGTEISSFDVDVIDVIAPEAGLSSARILVRVSGPAVDATGLGPGFSGSPVICDGRNAGAISEGLGDYGNDVALATPIEAMLRDRPLPPAVRKHRAVPGAQRWSPAARHDLALLRAARPLAVALTVSGLSGPTAALMRRAATRARRPLIVAPAGPVAGYPPADLRPGAAVAASISTGDLALAAVGTVTYRDGEDLWAFGHPLEGLGRRALFLQDAYVYTVIENPLGIPDFGGITYKLASADGYAQGAVTRDQADTISGKLGALPPSIPLHVEARDAGGRRVTLDSLLADERELGYGAGLSFLAPLGMSQALGELTGDFAPLTLRVCLRISVRELRRPLGFCNAYFSVDEAAGDLSEAGDLVDFFDLAPLHVRRASVSVRAEEGVEQDVIVGARGPRRARPGSRIRVRVMLQRRHGGRRAITVPVPVPRSLGTRRVHRLTLRGQGGGFSEEELIGELIALLDGELIGSFGSAEPKTVRQLDARIRGLRRVPGIYARFDRREPRLAFGSDEVSFDGRVRLRLRVRPRARR